MLRRKSGKILLRERRYCRAIARQKRTAARESFEGRSQLRRTVRREEMEDGGEGTAAKRVREGLRGLGERAFVTRTNNFAAGGSTELRGEGGPCESCETVPQRRSGVGRIEQLENGEGWVIAVCDFLPGQQMWRVKGRFRERQAKLLPAPQLLSVGAWQYTLSLVGYRTILAA